MQYTIILEKGKNSYGASVPDLPGCIAAGETKNELIKEAIELHLEGLKEDGYQFLLYIVQVQLLMSMLHNNLF